jgi:CRP-like cAMP-binding protein
MELMTFKKGSVIIREGDHDDNLYILLEGQVEISKSLVLPEWIRARQKPEKSLLKLSENDYPFFGEMALLEESPERSASITALRDCQMAGITKNVLLSILDKNAEIGRALYRNIACEMVSRLQKSNKDILKLTTALTLALEG